MPTLTHRASWLLRLVRMSNLKLDEAVAELKAVRGLVHIIRWLE